MIEVDAVDVSRQAHQLVSTHGRDAWTYAKRWADLADREGKLEETAFWRAVEATLKPR
jgi:hypothetical protein